MADPFSFAIATVAQIGISYLFPSEGPRLKDLKISASTYGAAIPWVFGLTRVPGNMIWASEMREQKKKKSGKGGAYNQYTYYCSFAMGLCNGSVTAVRRVWADNKLIYDATGGVTAKDATSMLDVLKTAVSASGAFGGATSKYRMRFYLGDEEQLPDSVIEADLGAGNAPAFRGLAYILFDDMPLEDFGNRIPQITAEVLVGASTTEVSVTPLKAVDNQYDLDPDYAPGEAAFDFKRALLYLRYDDGLTTVSLSDARARFSFSASDFGFEQGTLSRLLCLGPDGAVFVLRGEIGATANLDRLDPYSLQSMQSQGGVPSPVLAVCASNDASTGRLLTIAADGQARQFSSSDLAPLWSGTLSGAVSVCARDPDASGVATFFALRQIGGGQLALTRVQGDVVEDVHVFSAAQAGPILWDSAMPGVVMFFREAAGARIAKWSEDTDAEAWRTAIPGYPARLSPASRLLEAQVGWVHDGRLFLYDTATGASLDGGEVADGTVQADWSDYLVRYPDVRDAYYQGGWSVADTPEAYAQYHYTTYGAAEGRTLTYITSTLGQGIALSGDYAGRSGQTQALDASRGVLTVLDGLDGMVKASNIATGVSVGTVVARMLEEGGMPLVRTDLSALYQLPLRGYGWASGVDIKGVIDELRRLFMFDLVERDGLLVAKMRGDPDNGLGEPVEVIPQIALGSSSAEASDFWQETRFQEAELPAAVSLTYMNIDNDFETSTARSKRIANPVPTMFSRQQVAMEVNVVMTPTEAKVQTNKMLYSQWAERTKHETNLSWAYLNLDPSDVIQVRMLDGRVYEDRIHQTEIGADFSLALETYAQDSAAYADWEEITTGDGGGPGAPTVIAQPGMALPFVFNTPLIRDQDDQSGAVSIYYVGFGNARPEQAWRGAGLFRSLNDVDFDPIISPESDVEWATVLGDRLGAPHAGPFAMDWKTRLKLRPAVEWFEIESVTDDELLAGANLCLIGSEIIQFRDCVENEDGSWTIWNLLRGRRGTEYACDTHSVGERFVFLSNTSVGLALEQISARGQGRFFRSVPVGGSLQDQASLAVTYEPRDLMPYAPADIRRVRNETGDIAVTWARRTRLGGNLMDGTAVVPLAERSERYEAYVLDAAFAGDRSRGQGPAAFRRRLDVSAPGLTYTAAMQAEDGFGPSDTLHLVIYQMSDAVGRGFPGVRSIEPDEAF